MGLTYPEAIEAQLTVAGLAPGRVSVVIVSAADNATVLRPRSTAVVNELDADNEPTNVYRHVFTQDEAWWPKVKAQWWVKGEGESDPWRLVGYETIDVRQPGVTTVPESGGTGFDLDSIEARLIEIGGLLTTDPPTQTGSQQYRARKVVRGDSYSPTTRPFEVSRHRSASWPLDLSQWAWAFTARKHAENEAEGISFTGTVAVTTATGDSRGLTVTITSDTGEAALGRHEYAVHGTKDGQRWSPELGVIDVIDSPAP
jgi:hypothetical protein